MAAGEIDIGLTGRKKVLVAEDEQNIASLIEDWLSDSFEVILAANGAAAFQKAKWNKPDAVIMDIMMPDMGGYEVVCALQGDAVTAKIPVIVMTAKNFDDSTVKLIKAEPNVFGFLNKPFKPEELKKQVVQVMSGQRTFAAPTSGRRAAPAPGAPTPAAPPMAAPPRPAAPPAAQPPAAPRPLPPTPATVLQPGPMPARAPAPVVPPPPMPAASQAPAGLVHGFPEIVPPPQAAAPLPPFLKPSHMPTAPAAAPPPPPQPAVHLPASVPAHAIYIPPSEPVLEPTSAVPPAPPPVLELEERAVPVAVPAAQDLEPALAPPAPKPSKRLAVSRPVIEDEETGGGEKSWMAFKASLLAVKWVAKIFILGVSVFAAAETACRWTEGALGREVFVPPLRPSRIAALPGGLPFRTSWTEAGVAYAINEWGLREGEVQLIKAPNTLRVFVLGGTSSFGEELAADQVVAARLKALLSDQGGRSTYEVINGGMWGYSPEEQWTFYEEGVAELKPDVIVWLLEDKPRGFPASDKFRSLAEDSWLSSSLFSGSHLARLIMRRKLSDGASARKTDFLPLVQKAEKFARQSESKFLYALVPDRALDPGEREELPDRSRIDLPSDLSRAFLTIPAGAAIHRAVAEVLFERVRAFKPGGKKT